MKEKIKKLINKINIDMLLFVIVFFSILCIHNSIILNILLVSTIIRLLVKYTQKEKYKLSFLLTSTIILSLFVGVHYKLLFLSICCICIGYYLKKGKLLLFSSALLISPSIYLSNVYVITQNCLIGIKKSLNNDVIINYKPIMYFFSNLEDNKWANEYNQINGEYKQELKNNISYYYNVCQLYNFYCHPIKNKEKPIFRQLAIYLENVARFDNYGNIYHVVRNEGIDFKRYIYSFNQYQSSKNINHTTIFIPMNKEEVVIYNYFWLKDFVWEEVLQSKNKCKLLFYGTQNGWDKYRTQLINDLNNDKDNICIHNIEDYDIEIDKNKLNKDKKDFINILKDKG